MDLRYVSRYSRPTFAIQVFRNGEPGDADGDVAVSLYAQDSATTPAWTRNATRASEGVYEITLTSAETQSPGVYLLRFDYEINGGDEVFGFDFEVGVSSPAYDDLPDQWRGIVDAVWIRFADLFDSPYGGPNLQVYAQTNFGRNRMAQLMEQAMQTLNSITLPHASHQLGGESFPFKEWGGLLQRSLYVEVLKHLIRSYVEQPEAILGTAVSRLDRRDYMQRWQAVLDMEQMDLRTELGRYKMAHLGLGNVSVLVAGGAYGNLGPTVNAGSSGAAAARGYFAVARSH